jgi:hypothetical protein
MKICLRWRRAGNIDTASVVNGKLRAVNLDFLSRKTVGFGDFWSLDSPKTIKEF